MCDYSLEHVAARPARVGDRLVTAQFLNSFTRGFSAVGERDVAVCLLAGTEIAFDQEVAFEGGAGCYRTWKIEHTRAKVARFRQVNTHEPHIHHDALEFPDGKVVLLTRLIEGQRAAVLQLPASPRDPARDASVDREATEQLPGCPA